MMKTFFKRLVLGTVLFLCSFCSRAFAFELFKFEIAPKYSILNGQMNEHFYYHPEGKKVSELNWDFTAISCFGFEGSITWEFLTLCADFNWGLKKDSGSMYDSDWLNKSNYSMKTNYSISDNRLDSYYDMTLKLGANIKPVSFLTVTPYLGIQYSKIKFIANGGYGWYADSSTLKNQKGLNSPGLSYTDPQAVYMDFSPFGDVISYDIEKFHYLIGTRTTFRFLSRFRIDVSFDTAFYSLYNCIDKHLATNTQYLDKIISYFNAYNFGTTIDINIWNGLSAGTSFYYHIILERKGNDYTKNINSKANYKLNDTRKGGFSANYWNLDFFVKYSF